MASHRTVFLFLAGLVLIAVSLACGLGAEAPPEPSPEGSALPGAMPTQQIVAPPGVGTSAADVTKQAPQAAPAIPERRRITLEFPPKIRSGDSDIIRLTLEVDNLGNLTATAEIAGNTVTGTTVEIPNLYETHNMTVEARLDMAGVDVRPPELISSPLAPGRSVTFYWSVKPQGIGTFKGTAWLFLRFVNKTTGKESRRPLSAQLIEIQTTNLFGLSANFARMTGAIGSLVGGIIGFPFFGDIVKFLFRRRRKP